MKRGISLVALVITIIVLIILTAAVMLTATNTNIFDKAGEATNAQNEKEVYEAIQREVLDTQLEMQVPGVSSDFATKLQQRLNTKYPGSNATASYANEKITISYTLNGKTYELELNDKMSLVLKDDSDNGGGGTTYTAYEIGDEVTVGGEDFYVLEVSDANTSTVTLLAKYNLNLDGTEQAPNASTGDTACKFSNTNYWASAHSSYTDWATENLDLNTVSGETQEDAIYKAKSYAEAKGGTNGRLLKYEEADTLKTSYGNMIFGKANRQGKESSSYYLGYWLSSAYEFDHDVVWIVNGDIEDLSYRYESDNDVGVRPVMTVSKSLIS